MKIIVQSTNEKIKCRKLNKYFKQLVETLPSHRILKIIGINRIDDETQGEMVLMRSTHNHNKWYSYLTSPLPCATKNISAISHIFSTKAWS